MIKATKPKEIKVWIHASDLMQDFYHGFPLLLHPRKDGFKSRIRATVTIPAKSSKAKRK